MITVSEMNAQCRRIENLGLIIIDYLQLMQSGSRAENRQQAVSEISRMMKLMAKSWMCLFCVCASCQEPAP